MQFYKDIKKVKNPESLLVLVNKHHKLDRSYIPKDLEKINVQYAKEKQYLRKEAKEAFEKLCAMAKKDGFKIMVASTYRSYECQDQLYEEFIREKGLEYADLHCARKGHSEHQTGLAIDVEGENAEDDFENTKEFLWMKKHAHLYGFILRYPQDKTSLTGFKYEPWHYRYVGTEVSKKIQKEKLTFEEYYAYYLK